jgi:hypothetical protein
MDSWVASSSKVAQRSGDSMTPSRETSVDSMSLRIAVLLLSFVSYIRRTNRSGRNRTRRYEVSRRCKRRR